MNQQRFSYLLSLYSNDSMSFKEHDEFFEMVATGDYDDVLMAALENDFAKIKLNNYKSQLAETNEEIVQNILNSSKKSKIEKVGDKGASLMESIIDFFSVVFFFKII